jgi:hypothetical protein
VRCDSINASGKGSNERAIRYCLPRLRDEQFVFTLQGRSCLGDDGRYLPDVQAQRDDICSDVHF